jgi:hypothetical protein
MADKKNEMKFTILFSSANPDHVFAADKLNTQSRNNKANYIAQAVKYFEENSGMNTKAIEKTVMDILSKQNQSVSSGFSENKLGNSVDDGFKKDVAGALEMFKKQ